MKTLGPHRVLPAMDNKISDFLAGISRASSRVLMLDYDGTLAPFCMNPERAAPYPQIPEILRRLNQDTDTRVIIVSGRLASSTARLLAVPGVEIWGCHGLERLYPDGTLERPELDANFMQALADAIECLKREGLDQFFERKFGAIAIHWRGRDVLAGHLTSRVLHVWSTLAMRTGLRLVTFDGGIEIAVNIRDKGHVVRTVLSEMRSGCAAAYLGDDTTDENAFEALQGRGLNILVREEYRNTLADVCIRPPDDVEDFLNEWKSACQTRSYAYEPHS